MSKWKSSTLSSVATVITGPFGSQLHKSDYVSEGIASIMPQNIGNRTVDFNGIAYISEDDANRLSRYRVQENDIVYSRRGDVEKHAFITKSLSGALCGTGCLRVRFTCKDVYPEFISLYLDRPETKKWIRQHVVGSSMPNLNSGILSDVPICYPLKETQISITNILKILERKIQINNCIIAELEAMAKTVYDYWFVQFDFPDAGGKPYCSSGGEMALNEQLNREIPVGWKVESIISAFDVCYGYPFDTKQFVGEPNHQPVVRIRDILDSDTSAYTNESVDNKYWLCSKDLIIGMDGNFHMNFWHSTPALLNQRCVRIRGNGKHSALQAYFSAAPYIKAREQNVNRTTVGHLSANDIKALHVLTPPKELQNKATEMFESFLEKICAAKKENIELAKFRNWLLPMLMNGQVRVE